MNNNKYIIKKLSPWMMDELLAFSEITTFDVIFLREQDVFYKDTIQQLKSKNVNVYIKPYSLNRSIKKLFVSLQFLFSNLFSFGFDYNGVIGLKSIVWFLRLDMSLFSENSKIHTQFATQAALISLLIKKYFNGKPEHSFTFHAHDIYFNNKWFKLMVDQSHKSFSISKYNINYINKNYSQSDKVKLARLGVFRDLTDKVEKEDNSEVLSLGLISRLVEKKGISFLLQALLEIKKVAKYKVKLTIAGNGPLTDEILKFVKENNLADIVTYIGIIKGVQKQEFFNNLDVFILPSITLKNDMDGIPVVLMEAVAASLPIISTNVSGIPEICHDDYNGLLIEEKNVEAIIKAIDFMAENESKRKFYAKNSLLLSKEYDIVLNSKSKINELGWN